MRSSDRQLCALFRKMPAPAGRPNHQTRVKSELWPRDDFPVPMDKVDCERLGGDLDHEFQSKSSQTTRTGYKWLRLAAFFSLALVAQCVWSSGLFGQLRESESDKLLGLDDFCPQAEALAAPGHGALLEILDEEFGSTAFKLKAYESLGGAVRIPTESYDDLGLPSEDPRWEIETRLHEYLESRFPKTHANLKRTKVNTYALVYEWKGTEDLKPLLLTAHMDVVPVVSDTYDSWVNPPYSGYYDGEWIWGRGSCDDKPGVIGTLTAVETLLERGFVPSRTVILAFGIDEEIGGMAGAHEIGKYLLQNYGHDSLAMVVDEGGTFTDDQSGIVFATPAVTERGNMNIRMDVLTPGGHSSVPPKHTGIGILANLIVELEAHPSEPELVRGSAYHQGLECRARYDTSLPESLRQLVLQSQTSDEKLQELGDRLVDFDPSFYALSGTTQAIDIVGGGVKVNALPEVAWAVANYRIAAHSSISELMSHVIDITLPVSERHNMSLEASGEMVGSAGPSWGTIRLDGSYSPPLVPAPVTPTAGSGPYELLSGTIRSTLQTHLRTDELPRSVVVSPGLMTGNTDTRHYWNLTNHIFRYNHQRVADRYNGVHTINEAIRAEGFLEQIRFFTRLILNADRSDLLV